MHRRHLQLLAAFLDHLWAATAGGMAADRVDLRANLPDKGFLQLMGSLDGHFDADSLHKSSAVLAKLKDIFRLANDLPSKIALRMTRGPTKVEK